MASWEKAAVTLSEHIHEETGIQIDDVDFTFITEDGTLKVKLNSYDFAQIDYSEDEPDEESMAIELIQSIGDVKQKLVEIKISQLREFLPGLEKTIKLILKDKNIQEEKISSLDFDVIDMGYSNAIQLEEEYTRGYPELVLVITNPFGLYYSYPLNIFYPDAPVDEPREFISRLLEDIAAI